MQHPTPPPTRAVEPRAARRLAGQFYGAAVAGAVLAIGNAGIAMTMESRVFDALAAFCAVVATLCYGQARYLHGWCTGRSDAGLLVDRAADDAHIPAERVRAFRVAASIAAGSQA